VYRAAVVLIADFRSRCASSRSAACFLRSVIATSTFVARNIADAAAGTSPKETWELTRKARSRGTCSPV